MPQRAVRHYKLSASEMFASILYDLHDDLCYAVYYITYKYITQGLLILNSPPLLFQL